MLFFFFFNDTATTEIYTLSLHDALPISDGFEHRGVLDESDPRGGLARVGDEHVRDGDRKSTRLNSSHSQISYAVFCLKKKKKKDNVVNVIDKSIDWCSYIARCVAEGARD